MIFLFFICFPLFRFYVVKRKCWSQIWKLLILFSLLWKGNGIDSKREKLVLSAVCACASVMSCMVNQLVFLFPRIINICNAYWAFAIHAIQTCSVLFNTHAHETPRQNILTKTPWVILFFTSLMLYHISWCVQFRMSISHTQFSYKIRTSFTVSIWIKYVCFKF